MIARITSVSTRSRGLLLLPAGAFVVHQLRYWLAYGPHAEAQLQAQGHSYLDSFAPWLVLLLCLAAGSFLARVAQAAATGRAGRRGRSFGAIWASSSAMLVAVYAVQEFLEGLSRPVIPAGVHGIVGHGGWWAGVLAVAVGAVIAARAPLRIGRRRGRRTLGSARRARRRRCRSSSPRRRRHAAAAAARAGSRGPRTPPLLRVDKAARRAPSGPRRKE